MNNFIIGLILAVFAGLIVMAIDNCIPTETLTIKVMAFVTCIIPAGIAAIIAVDGPIEHSPVNA